MADASQAELTKERHCHWYQFSPHKTGPLALYGCATCNTFRRKKVCPLDEPKQFGECTDQQNVGTEK